MKATILISGPESSGKTTLFSFLKMHLQAEGIEDLTRSYFATRAFDYQPSDILEIAKNLEKEMERKRKQGGFLMDTGFVNLAIWERERFNISSPLIEQLCSRHKPTLVLLCRPDIPWTKDPLRENSEDRDRLFGKFLQAFLKLGIPIKIIEGEGREEKALLSLRQFLELVA